ncbi:Regulatory protein BlaR1 [Aquisphaera giovannonii]|uniref:Regulatory protein BlaR1 n=1 Tax=Aquisphaera giovannonii TaxID=406548 RepID=A0A5B9VU86_9BACT|nr:M56 family metallopeptidase [Aquisphaera giovannonii]QEH31634.1 Regulatory protein BlaR1 [Aquisphaera giovannonii]
MLYWFAETTLVAGLLAAAAALAGRLRALDAPARHLLWVLVLVKLVTPPLVRSPWAVALPPALVGAGRPVASDATVAPAATASPPGRDAMGAPGATPAASARPVSLSTVDPPGRPIAREPAAAVLRELVVEEGLRAFRRGGAGPKAEAEAEPAAPAAWLPAAARWLMLGWAAGAAALAAVQGRRILAFRGRLREAVPAPGWLVEEAERVGESLRVRPPEVLAAAGLGTPLLWCLGRPKLLVPAHLIKSLDAGSWPGILAHELAHLRRGDHWVARLELAAGLLWWWNPLYWVARRRIDAEAELACDAWVVSALPRDRHAYAEVLLQICSEMSLQRPSLAPAPALGVAGSGRFLERRLLMVLNAHRDDPSACRITPLPLAAACLLGLLALPSWSLAKPVEPAAALAAQPPDAAAAAVEEDEPSDEDASIAFADDDDDDDDKDKEKHKPKAQARPEKHEKQEKHEAKEEDDDDKDDEAEAFAAEVEKTVEEALGPDFEKDMEAWGEKLGKEMEERFGDGSEFQKKMEAFGKEMEKKFGEGSEFQKKMEAFGKEMEKKFGEGSEFEKKMEAFGKKMEQKFGPGSEFEKKMKEKAEAAEQKARAKADDAHGKAKAAHDKLLAEKVAREKELAERAKQRADRDRERADREKEKADRERDRADAARHKAEADAKHKAEADAKHPADGRPNRERRIKDLESKVESLLKEIKSLKDED